MPPLDIAALVAAAAAVQCYARAWAYTRRARRSLSALGERRMLVVFLLGPHTGLRYFDDHGQVLQRSSRRWTLAALGLLAVALLLHLAGR